MNGCQANLSRGLFTYIWISTIPDFLLSVRLYSLRKIVNNQERLRELVSKDNRKQKYRWNKLKIYAELMTMEVK